MGSITSGIGLISGIDTASLIEQLLAVHSQGRGRLESQRAILEAQRAATLDINARLLAFQTTAAALRLDDVFGAASVSSSHPDVLTATAGRGVLPGSYQMVVGRLASNSQIMSSGFADATSPIGLTELSLEFGRGALAPDTPLVELNGGTGIDRGRMQITTSDGTTGTVDLGEAITVEDVLDRINSSGLAVTAAVSGDAITVTDDSGGGGTFQIANGIGDSTASDLGLATSDGSGDDADGLTDGTITGRAVRTVGASTTLATLNDGNGVLIRDGVTDLSFRTRSGVTFEVDLGRVDADITDATLIEDLNDGAGVTINGDAEADLQIVDADGGVHDIDLTGIATVGDFRSRVATQSGGAITISITDGDHFTVEDNSGGAGELTVVGSGPNGTATAEDLGILETDGVSGDLTGDVIINGDYTPAATTLGEIVDRINDATGNAGMITASLGATGIIVDDSTLGIGNLIVTGTAGNASAAGDLGIEIDEASSNVTGDRLIAGLDTVLVRNLNGGAGLGGGTTLTITDRNGSSSTMTGLDAHDSLEELLEAVRAELDADSVDVAIGINAAGNGLLVTDTSGGNGALIVGGSAASALGIDGISVTDSIVGDNVQLRYVSAATRLDDLDFGRGVGTGTIRIIDGEGNAVNVSIGSDAETLDDVISEINALASAQGVDVTAQVNANGDGLLLSNDLGAGVIEVQDVTGVVARQLRIEGRAATDGGDIDGSQEVALTFNASDSLDDIVAAIAESDAPVAASILDTGGGPTPVHLMIGSSIDGARGALHVSSSGVDLGFATVSEGRDAALFFGAEDPADGVLITSANNTIDGVVPGVTIDLLAASDDPVTLTATRDVDSIVAAVSAFVDAFNDVIERIDAYDFYDAETEQRGVLLGDGLAGRVRAALLRTATSAADVDGAYRYLTEVGVEVASEGKLTFDEAEFRDAYEADPESVETLLAGYEATTTTSEEVADGVTVPATNQTYEVLGFGDRFALLLDELTAPSTGSLARADDAYGDRIDLIDGRIESLDVRLAARRARLEAQFAAMELALARLQEQGSSLLALQAQTQQIAGAGLI